MDLPISENPMFHLDDFPTLDRDAIREYWLHDHLLEESYTTVLQSGFPQDLQELEEAHDRQDWKRIIFVVHRGIGVSALLGFYKLKQAGIYLYDYHDDKHTLLLEPLYQQVIRLIHEAMQALIEREPL